MSFAIIDNVSKPKLAKGEKRPQPYLNEELWLEDLISSRGRKGGQGRKANLLSLVISSGRLGDRFFYLHKSIIFKRRASHSSFSICFSRSSKNRFCSSDNGVTLSIILFLPSILLISFAIRSASSGLVNLSFPNFSQL